jgi:cell division septation protein DedD
MQLSQRSRLFGGVALVAGATVRLARVATRTIRLRDGRVVEGEAGDLPARLPEEDA